MQLLANILLLIGSIFLFLGALGLVRMPDVYNRIQAGTKATTLGALTVLLGMVLHHPGWWLKLLLIAVFILITSPVASSTLARSAWLIGFRPYQRDVEADSAAKNTGAGEHIK
ncbi:monovalent cation/H(+) antiporter subunit G [Candidatus Venteria ishoeyi]|uniref:Na(+)/H(+) antiporter subunit G n=1 Tax=Candidatus Venteria ishoeyi TaxID=1899563 RepID=A0A1H6FEF2_9GAMM|nr:monovalent cation/H(+) antiporter subunit G [Candidatus Venteria ishoeyi]MDM8547078.1 monovalent cation/H(+) antiporter subunit G [Candidatus Venteria ishoeyi]SEH07709.1 Na(+)/H(+) antiporter subunit G [Candidatus Venteria ishoeyi]